MRVINIVDSLDKVNFGIYNAAVFTAKHLKAKYGVESELWFPETHYDEEELNGCIPVPLNDTSSKGLKYRLQNVKLDPTNDMVVTHGAWRYPTRWGNGLKKHGFNWVYVPHGMLEPWSVKQKRLKKSTYLRWFEVPAARNANAIRAVGAPEQENLKEWFSKTVLIPNGVEAISVPEVEKPERTKVLFMGRLHYKKGIVPLVKAWQASSLYANKDFELVLAGPDDGELEDLKALMAKGDDNISYLGAVYGQEKEQLLAQSSFYILPSVSEGFPTSVLEALQYGLVPIITEGCNFPELFEAEIGFRTEQDVQKIKISLDRLQSMDDEWIDSQTKRAKAFVNRNYSLEHIADLQFELYSKIMDGITV